MFRKGLSSVVATVLLVMLTVASVSLIYAFVVPMIKDSLAKSKECYDVQGYIKISDSEYTCSGNGTRIMVERGSNNLEIKGFIISLKAGGTGKRFDVIPGSVAGVKMYDGNISLRIPDAGGAETYVFSLGNATSADIAPILSSGKTCDAVSALIHECG